MKIKLTCVKSPTSKLRFVKAIKMATDLGLKEAKEKTDFLFANLNTPVEIELVENSEKTNGHSSIDYLRNELPECGGETIINGGVEWERNLKMLNLGLGQNEEYVDFLSEYLRYNQQENIIKSLLSKLSKEELISLTNKIEI